MRHEKGFIVYTIIETNQHSKTHIRYDLCCRYPMFVVQHVIRYDRYHLDGLWYIFSTCMVKNIVTMLNLKKNDTQHDNNGSWCTLLIDNSKITAKISHIGRGRFKILAAQNGDKYINHIVDASDVFSCTRE